MSINADHNVDTHNIHVAEYDWGETPAGVPIEEANIVLAADCVYFEVNLHHRYPCSHLADNTACLPSARQDAV